MSKCLSCSLCAQVGNHCISHAMGAAVEAGDKDRAYAIAKQYGRPESAVRVLVRDQLERQLQAETRAMTQAGQVHVTTPVQRARSAATRHAVEDMLVAVERATRAA